MKQMTSEVLHAPSGTYELLNGFYKKRLMRTNPDSPWYGKIAGIAPGTEVIRVIKDPVGGAISLSVNQRLAKAISLTYQVKINSDDTVTSIEAFAGVMAEPGTKVPPVDVNQMLVTFKEAFCPDVADLCSQAPLRCKINY